MNPWKKSLLIPAVVISVCTLMLVVPYAIIPSSFASGTVTFSPAINLSNDAGSADWPAVASYQNHVYVVWTEGTGGMLFRESSDGGSTWVPPLTSPALKISVKGGTARFPVMFTQNQAVDPGTVLIAFAQSTKGELQTFAAVSTNYGVSFNTVQLSTEGGIIPAVAGAGSDLYVTWYQVSGCPGNAGGGCIMVSSSTNSGASWGTPIELNPSFKGEEQIVASGSNAYLIADGIYFEASYNNGATWSTPLQVFNVSFPNEGREPWIAANGSLVYITWEANSTSPGVLYQDLARTSTDGGQTWGPVQTVGLGPDTWEPEPVAYGSSVWMTDRSLTTGEVFVEMATNVNSESPTWSTPYQINSGLSTKTAAYGHLFTSDGVNIFLLWGQPVGAKSNPSQAYVSYSDDGGSTWSNPIDISNNAQGSAAADYDITLFSLSSYGTACYAAWVYTIGSTSQIYFAAS